MRYTPDEPIAAIATSLTPAALGIVRTSGKGAVDLTSKVFSRPGALLHQNKIAVSATDETVRGLPTASLVYGWIIDPATNEKIDEVMVGVFRSPKSFTGEDMTEIYCHGGVSVVTGIYRLLLASGFRDAERGEFSFRAYINGKTDLTRAEAAREITAAKTGDARSRAAGRLAGTLFDELSSIKQLLVKTRAAIEAEIEYPEDENAIAGAFDDGKLKEAERRLTVLCGTWGCEKLYQDGARVVLCGRTNAGKSSVFNALLKEDRAIVSDAAGTTRDWLESWVSFDGLPVRLFDTAGLRETADSVEKSGVERTLDLAGDADCILYIVDAEIGITAEDEVFLRNQNKKNQNMIIVFNKIDKVREKDYTGLGMSAKTGEGIPAVIAAVNKALKNADTEDRSAQAGLGSERQKKCAEEALAAVKSGIKAEQNGFPLDAVVQDVDDALAALGEITGEVTPEDILDTVFQNFCVGK